MRKYKFKAIINGEVSTKNQIKYESIFCRNA